jgi:hypothetical protein
MAIMHALYNLLKINDHHKLTVTFVESMINILSFV